ncbi:MAG: type II secretion system GspH family protein [Holophagales bacterium]|jgi:general secretion pathway protein G|nr:type II secretion system GspH family protein [Holophagales bacterium]
MKNSVTRYIAMNLRKRSSRNSAGFTLFELLVTLMVLSILSAVAIPSMKNVQRRNREIVLYQTLRQMREAIDNYKRAADQGLIDPGPPEYFGYPASLEVMVSGVSAKSGAGTYRFLRQIPKDPIAGTATWAVRSIGDDTGTGSGAGGCVFDVHSTARGSGLNGVPYSEW